MIKNSIFNQLIKKKSVFICIYYDEKINLLSKAFFFDEQYKCNELKLSGIPILSINGFGLKGDNF